MSKPYYCTKCKRTHKSGKVFEDHKQYKRSEEKGVTYSDDIIKERLSKYGAVYLPEDIKEEVFLIDYKLSDRSPYHHFLCLL